MIYFIQSGRSEFVKIGYCKGEPRARLGQLQVGNPEELRLLAVIDGDLAFEAYIHQQLSHLRVRGEWFKWSDEMAEWARPLLDEPNALREVRAQHARDLVAGRTSSEELYRKLLRVERHPAWARARNECLTKPEAI
jgi:hypothetical protein